MQGEWARPAIRASGPNARRRKSGELTLMASPQTAPLGGLVLAAFDEAARYSANAREAARMATAAVMNMLLRSRRRTLSVLRRRLSRRVRSPGALHFTRSKK